MLNDQSFTLPPHFSEVLKKSLEINFDMLSDLKTGSLLRTLCASKPGARILELGTGTGLSLCWLADGADKRSSIISIDNTLEFQSIAREVFKEDPRIELLCLDANSWLQNDEQLKFDIIFADAWPGKFENLDKALALLNIGGFFLIDDLLPQPNWPEQHQQNVDRIFMELTSRKDLTYTSFNWSTGLMLFTKL